MKKSLLRSAVCVLLTLLLLLGTVTIAVSATGEEQDRIYKGTFRYYDDRTEYFFYSDGYFKNSGKEQNVHLRTLSAAVAFTTERLTGDDNRLLELLTDTGFDPATVSYEEMDVADTDTIGTVIAQKDIDGTPLVLVSIRGIGYDGEWASNFTAGAEGDAQGFSEAAETVLGRIDAYLSKYDLNDAKIWVCGYSRTGSVANLVGRELNKAPEAYRTCDDDIYVYTFEAPACSADDTVYENIHNVANSNDLITYFYPEQWGLYLNGVTETIGDPDAAIMSKKLSFSFKDFSIDDYKEVKTSDFLKQFSEFISTNISRGDYVNNLEGYLKELSVITFGKTQQEQMELLGYLENVGTAISEDKDLPWTLFLLMISQSENSEDIESLAGLIIRNMDAVRADTQPPLTDEEYQTLTDAVRPLLTTMKQLIDADKQYTEKDEHGIPTLVPFYHLLTLTSNIKDIIMTHIHFNIFEYLKAEDPYYDEDFTVAPGAIYADDTIYTYDELGEELFSKAVVLNFSRHDIYMLRNGYDLRLDVDITPHEDDYELTLKCMGVLPKSRHPYGLYDIKVLKTVGFRTYAGAAPASITISDDIANYTKDYSVARCDDEGPAQIECKRIVDDDGTTRVGFLARGSAVYCVARGDLHIDPSQIKAGDVDQDLEITSVDATLIQRYLSLLEDFNELQRLCADVDGDGEISVIDVTQVQRYLAYMPSVLDE